jgi:hypothetical protein
MTINKLLCQPDGLALVGATQVDATLDVTVFSNDVGAIYSCMCGPQDGGSRPFELTHASICAAVYPVNGHSQDRRACLTGANFGGPRNVIS